MKAIRGEAWTEQELQYFLEGGNQAFFDYLKKYNLEHAAIYPKYSCYPTTYYGKQLAAKVTGVPCDMHAPLDDWRDDVMIVAKKAEIQI